jgi:hypothetical protein
MARKRGVHGKTLQSLRHARCFATCMRAAITPGGLGVLCCHVAGQCAGMGDVVRQKGGSQGGKLRQCTVFGEAGNWHFQCW